ncbi:hypothetical protein [Labrys neptuniae]
MAGASMAGAGTTTMACIAAGVVVVMKAGADMAEGAGMTDGAGMVAGIIAGDSPPWAPLCGLNRSGA